MYYRRARGGEYVCIIEEQEVERLCVFWEGEELRNRVVLDKHCNIWSHMDAHSMRIQSCFPEFESMHIACIHTSFSINYT